MGLSKKEIELVYDLASRLTGTDQSGDQRHEVLVSNVERRMNELGLKNFTSYLKLAQDDQAGFESLVSDLTIHTTSWFRESPHFKLITRQLEASLNDSHTSKKLNVWSAASSTGEEVYSIALVLEEFREKYGQRFDYSIRGSDVDPVSVRKARRGIYNQADIRQIPEKYHRHLLLGGGKAKGFFTLSKEVRNRCHFSVYNLNDKIDDNLVDRFDAIFCRNVLIYFQRQVQSEIISRLSQKLKIGGTLVLGHCDSFPSNEGLKSIGQSCFLKLEDKEQPKVQLEMSKKKALVVDDSGVIRKIVSKVLQSRFEIVEAESAAQATEILKSGPVDFISLDLNMPGESGAAWLTQFRNLNQKTPVVILSDSSAVDAQRIFGALLSGAQDYVTKSQLQGGNTYLLDVALSLTEEKKELERHPEIQPFNLKKFNPQMILIGASTGGPEALSHLLSNLPSNLPPIVVVQHISHEFAKAFAERMAEYSKILTVPVDQPTPLKNGCIYLSGGDYHIEIQKKSGQLLAIPNNSSKVLGHRPAVDNLFKSASQIKSDSLAILLTGMGRDGAEGMLELFQAGKCFTIAQNAKSSIVFGMPKKAIEAKAVTFVGDIFQIRHEMLNRSRGSSR